MWLLDLLQHSTVDRKGILQVQYYKLPMQLIKQNIIVYSQLAK